MEENTIKTNRLKYLIGIAITVLIVYNIALFGIAGFIGHTATFWISYVFQLLTFVAIIIALALLENKNLRLHDWLFRLPLIKHSVIYAFCELIVSVTFMIVSHKLFWGIALAVQIILLGIYLVFALSCLVAKEMVTEVNNNINIHNTNIKLLRLDAEMVARTTHDEVVKEAFTKLAEQIRYSDPMGSDKLAELENELSICVKSAFDAVKRNDSKQSMEYYNRAVLLLVERNEKCKIYK